MRFVTTNTSVDAFGLLHWFEDDAIRFIMERTRERAHRKVASCELWRVYVLKRPSEFASDRYFGLFAAVLRDNIYSGIRTCVFNSKALPEKYSYSYSDFFCIPGRIASVAVAPYYLLTVFYAGNSDDEPIISYYSDFAEDLIRLSINPNFPHAFEWSGNSEDELRNLLLPLVTEENTGTGKK